MKELKTRLFACFLIGLCILFLSDMTEAETFCVSTAEDLQIALNAAETNEQDDVIQLVQGAYVGNFVYAPVEPDPDGRYGLTIEGGYTTGCASREIDPNNTILDAGGSGTVLFLSAPGVPADFVVDGLTLQNGYLFGSGGLGLYSQTDGEITLRNSRISDNRSDNYARGILIVGANEVNLFANIINRNEKEGVLIEGAKRVTLNGNTVTNNHYSGGDGGGIYVNDSEIVVVNKNIISKNYGGDGGGLCIGSTEKIIITNNTISSNSVPGFGAGVLISGGERHNNTVITNNTFYRNDGVISSGGGICLDWLPEKSVIEIYNNIFWENKNQSGDDISIYNKSPDQLYIFNNDFDQSADGTWIQIPPVSFDPSNLNNEDPLFVDALNDDFHLSEGSPCINAGYNDAPELPATDFEGDPRVVGPAPDMGADEFVPLAVMANINIRPRVLNLKSKGKWILCSIRVPADYNPQDIEGDTLEMSILSCSDCQAINVSCGFPLHRRYLAFFPRQGLIDKIETMNLELPVELGLKVSGNLIDETPFEGSDTIWVIKPGR